MTDHAVLLLRLAGPLQSWGGPSDFNRRDTLNEPTKSGIIGLLSAAQGRQRTDPISDLLDLELGVRVDQPGTLLGDYHTASDFTGKPLKAAAVTNTGLQKFATGKGSPKYTHVTRRYYLQDAVFVAAIRGPLPVIDTLDQAVQRPVYPLALGRRPCAPVGPLIIDVREDAPDSSLTTVLTELPWQVSEHAKELFARRFGKPATVDLSMTVDDVNGSETRQDVPTTFNPHDKQFTPRTVCHKWVKVPTGFPEPDDQPTTHDPFALLGW